MYVAVFPPPLLADSCVSRREGWMGRRRKKEVNTPLNTISACERRVWDKAKALGQAFSLFYFLQGHILQNK